ncbi:MAG: hypothetical protein KatS3mg003_0983 [Candidatus Nitrosocaldaceae archaeon]|nr:MAG: hypothetical protein KatS3mg003_0983 [Candidatus Nitrosocaldaceae archaeon]
MSVRIELKAKIPDLVRSNVKALRSSIKELSRQLLNEIKNRAPVDTGMLRSSFRASIIDESNKIKAKIESSVPYALMLEYGTNAHIITAKQSKALHFIADNNEVFVKSVMHPGIKGRFYIKQSIDNTLPRFNSILSKNLAREMNNE